MSTTSSTVSHVKIIQAGLLALATSIVGVVCATVPSLAPDKQIIIGVVTAALIFAGLIANAVHALASSNVSARDVEARAVHAGRIAGQSVLADADLSPAVSAAIDARHLPALQGVGRAELKRILTALFPAAEVTIDGLVDAESIRIDVSGGTLTTTTVPTTVPFGQPVVSGS